MKFKKTADHDVIEGRIITSPGLLVLGLPLLACGVVIIIFTFFIPTRGGDLIPWFVGLPAGGLFLAIGWLLVFGRRSKRINRRKGVLEDCFGMPFTIRRSTSKLNEFNHLLIKVCIETIRESDNRRGTRISHTVDLVGTHSKTLGIYATKEEAIGAAEYLSRFLNLDVHDKSDHGQVNIRKADTMDETLKERMRRLQHPKVLPKPPDELKSSIRDMNDSFIVGLPARYGFNGAITIMIIMGFVIYSLQQGEIWPKLVEILPKPTDSWLVGKTACTVTGIFLTLTIIGLYLIVTNKKMSLEINAGSVTMKVKRFLYTSVTEIPYNELEDLHVSNDGAIYARSDKKSFTFGKRLSRSESEYICDVIKAKVQNS